MKKELQSFLGIVATFHRWNPNISQFSKKLRHLNSKGIHFSVEKDWTPELAEELQKLKKEITTAFQKKPFDEKKGCRCGPTPPWRGAWVPGGLRGRQVV